MTLTKHYESFTIKDGESGDDIFGRLLILLNNLEALEHMYSKARINLKVLDNFPKAWEPKTTTIQDAILHGLSCWVSWEFMKSTFKKRSICKRRISLLSSLKRQVSDEKKIRVCLKL